MICRLVARFWRRRYSTTSATMADVDATYMAVTFTAPASGNVIVTLSAWDDTKLTKRNG